jgi:hypothetical protein
VFSFHRLRGKGFLDTSHTSTVLGGKNRRMYGDNAYTAGRKVAYSFQLALGCWVLCMIIRMDKGGESPYILQPTSSSFKSGSISCQS